MDKKMPQKPCVGCVYFKACGNTNRTEPCFGRKTKSGAKKEQLRRGNVNGNS